MFRAILLDSFPPSQLDDLDLLLQSIANGSRWLTTVTDNGKLTGFAVIAPFVGPSVHLLEYLVVERSARNQGTGALLLKAVCTEGREATGILLEVEPDDEGTKSERALRRRRIGFYLRNGAQFVQGAEDYCVPNMAGPGTLAMRLMWLGINEQAPPTGPRLRDLIRGIYMHSYRLSDDSPLVQALVTS